MYSNVLKQFTTFSPHTAASFSDGDAIYKNESLKNDVTLFH